MTDFPETWEVLDVVGQEIRRAEDMYPGFKSAHEGYAILLEEVDELWDEIKKKDTQRDKKKMRTEAIQVAAMAIRFIKDCT